MRPDDRGDDADTSAGGSSAPYARVCFPGVGADHGRGHCRGANSKSGVPLRRAASRQARPSCFQTGRAGLVADLRQCSLSRAFGPRHGRGCRTNSLRRRRWPVDAGRALAKNNPLDLWLPGAARASQTSEQQRGCFGLRARRGRQRRSLAIAPGLWHMSFALCLIMRTHGDVAERLKATVC